MINGPGVRLRPVGEADWPVIEAWAESGELWGAFQRHQIDHLPLLRKAFESTGLLSRHSALLLIEPENRPEDHDRVVGFVRFTLIEFPDGDFPHPEIGFGIADPQARHKGLATTSTRLLVDYLFATYACERISAITDEQNVPAQKVLERSGFEKEGVIRRASFLDGAWRDMALYGALRTGARADV